MPIFRTGCPAARAFQREIKDIISYLRVIANPDDDINLLRIINTAARYWKNTGALRNRNGKNALSAWRFMRCLSVRRMTSAKEPCRFGGICRADKFRTETAAFGKGLANRYGNS
ncbi:hypothetical protein ABH09_11975 [Treponema sp. OMZ 803]|uniref:3'-5' exonuclease n=1 Tax=Treponema sp. OMZ 803 TaxID=120682 RepID=UPI0020A2F0AB|nr:3'-5' exonuclease [Treponema sp. OMZ 803]UTC53010.1 hypothetical protein ABH09_11975 [Treponema sp. OMZ 803]